MLVMVMQLFIAQKDHLFKPQSLNTPPFLPLSRSSSTSHLPSSPRGTSGPDPSNSSCKLAQNREPTVPVSSEHIIDHINYPNQTRKNCIYQLLELTFLFTQFQYTEQLPTPEKIRETQANENAKLTEFQQELMQLAAVMNGDDIFTSYPEAIGKDMNVKEGRLYMREAVRRFFEAGHLAKTMGVSEDQIVQMRPSLATRSSQKPKQLP